MTILREAEHEAIRQIMLSGRVLDLGGDARSAYRTLFRGSCTFTTVNMAPEAHPDIVTDLEKPLPIASASYDGVVLMNVLEHVFEYRALLDECSRVLVPGGTMVIAVPYLFPYHPSPDDYFRFSRSAITQLLTAFTQVQVVPLGSGVCAARTLLLERLLPERFQAIISVFSHPLARALDAGVTTLARLLKKAYNPSDYALGFVVTAQKK